MPFQKGHEINKGRKLTDEHKKKISISCKGNSGREKGCIPWNKGFKDCYSEYTLRAMSKAKKDKKWEEIFGEKKAKEMKRLISKRFKGKRQGFKQRYKKRLSQLGEKGSGWKGGRVNLNNQIRESFLYKEWRKAVFERDKYVCQGCNQKGGYLEVHHKESVNNILNRYQIKTIKEAELCKELWNISNGVTYCVRCHKKYDEKRKCFIPKI